MSRRVKNDPDPSGVPIGPYRGGISAGFATPAFTRWLADLERHLTPAAGARIVAGGRHQTLAVPAPPGLPVAWLLVKRHGRQSGWRDGRDRRRGSKAARTWDTATRLRALAVGAPAPAAWLERWEGARLRDCFYVAEFLEAHVSVRDELVRLYHDDPECARFMRLLQVTAEAVRRMHDAGFLHHDLGNQNILVRRAGPDDWTDPRFIDLNRGRWRETLGPRERGRDLSRLNLPSDLLRVFIEMYWREAPPPALLKWERCHRRLYALHADTRHWRHPWRSRRRARALAGQQNYPAPRDLWIWDERSAQAIVIHRPRDRKRLYPWRRQVWPVLDTARALPGVWREFQRLRAACFQSPVAFAGRIGMSVDPQPERWPRERELLTGLSASPLPVLIRFYAHEAPARRAFRLAAAHELHAAGHAVMAALVQDRRAVRDPAGRWRPFVQDVLEGLRGVVREVEVGHAINRVKWGLWDPRELTRLYAEVAGLRTAFPEVVFSGPAGLDFEYPYVISALRRLPAGLRFGALSHHLYLDRRGAPENRQGGFSGIEKFALARAIARHASSCDDRLIVSGVNWPLQGTGVYSPVGAPYESPGVRTHDPSVSENQYADYLLRYLLLALASGMVDRVYWWRLVAHGFGLVDDIDPRHWRPRPAYDRLAAFLAQVGDATCVAARLPPPETAPRGHYAFDFQRPDGERLSVQYGHGAPSGDSATALAAPLTGSPVYLRERPRQPA